MRAVSVQAKFYGVVIEYMILKRSASVDNLIDGPRGPWPPLSGEFWLRSREPPLLV
jgi:hypothetical protein